MIIATLLQQFVSFGSFSKASGSSKPTSVHYDVDSNRTCRELYLTVIEYINFYK